MPYRSVAAAERAALEGEATDWDTQACGELAEIFSVGRSPAAFRIAGIETDL
jgi:hypothetical protein